MHDRRVSALAPRTSQPFAEKGVKPSRFDASRSGTGCALRVDHLSGRARVRPRAEYRVGTRSTTMPGRDGAGPGRLGRGAGRRGGGRIRMGRGMGRGGGRGMGRGQGAGEERPAGQADRRDEVQSGTARRVVAVVDAAQCLACGLCVRVCPAGTIAINGTVSIDAGKCTGCGRCVAECPQAAIALRSA